MGWTQQDLEIYNVQLNKIKFECLGKFYIGGIFYNGITGQWASDQPAVLTFYAFRIYDENFYPDQLGVSKNGPLTEHYAFGTKGLVVVPAKDKETGSFHNLKKDASTYSVPHPAAVWMDLRYKGQSYVIGRQVMYEHIGTLYQDYTTLNENMRTVPAFSYEDMDQKLLPAVWERFQLEIMAADSRRELTFA